MKKKLQKYFIFFGPFLITFLVGIYVESSIADLYKWVDQNGVIHISDSPPHNVDNSKIDRQQGVPFAVINGKSVHGYSEKAYNNALSN